MVANFSVITVVQYSITLSSIPSSGGTTSGAGTFSNGSSITVSATPNSGYTFTNWTENGTEVSANKSYTFTITGNRTLVANFSQIQYVVTTSNNPSGGGTTSGSGAYSIGSSVTLTAVPNTGYTFTNWTENGTVVSTSSSYTFTITGYRALTANYTLTQYVVSVSNNPSNGGSISGSGTFNMGSSVVVTATANSGFTFTNWTESGMVLSTSKTYTFLITGNRSLTANYSRVKYQVAITSNPTSGGKITGSGTYDDSSNVTITAVPTNSAGSKFKFTNWTENGIEISKNITYSFIITKNRTFTANFTDITAIEQLGVMPSGFALQQNYPNPFNPTTKIQFSIPEESLVRLSIYNILGQEIARLVDQELSASIYLVDFDATELPGGIYFYKLQTGAYTQTKKMILAK